MEGDQTSDTGDRAPASAPTLSPAPQAAPPQPHAGTPATQQSAGQPLGPTTGIGGPIPIPNKQLDWESGYQNEHGPRPSRWEAWGETPFKQGVHDSIAGSPLVMGGLGAAMAGGDVSPKGALWRLLQEQDAKTGKMLSPEDANKAYPGRPVPYTTPVDEGMASMEYADRKKQQDLAVWAAQRPMTTMGRIASTAAGFVGGLTDPLNLAIGAMSGSVASLVAPEAAPLALKGVTHYLANLGGFTAADALQNFLDHKMGAKQKQLPEMVGESAVPAAIMTGLGVGLGALARRFSNEGGGTSESDARGIKATVANFENDKRVPQLEDLRNTITDRRSGASSPDPGGQKIRPTLLSSPMQETPMYAAAHSDGTPLVHEHGLGPGVQFTDSHDVANNGVSRSTETPGHIAETKLPEGTKLLDIDRPAAEDYHSENSLLKEVEKKLGIPLDSSVQNGESLKEVITNLGDWAGADLGDGKQVPEDVLKQIQDVAKAQGFDGYQFQNDANTARTAHMFDTSGMTVDKLYPADPATTPALPGPEGAQPEIQGAQPAQQGNPALEKAEGKFYSPEIEKLAHEFRKGKTFDPYSPEEMANTQADIEQYKKQLADLAKTSDTAQESLETLRKQEAQDARLCDIAKRIADCGSGGGV